MYPRVNQNSGTDSETV